MWVKKHHLYEKYYGRYLVGIIDDSAIMCYEVIELHDEDAEAKSYNKTSFNENKATCKMQNLYILLAFFLITIALLIAFSIYCYLIKYWAIQSRLLLLHLKNKLKL